MIRTKIQYEVTKSYARFFFNHAMNLHIHGPLAEVHPALHQAEVNFLLCKMDEFDAEIVEWEARSVVNRWFLSTWYKIYCFCTRIYFRIRGMRAVTATGEPENN